MSRRARLGFVAACLLAFALIAALITWGPPSLVLQPEFVILLVRAARGRLEPAGRQGDHR